MPETKPTLMRVPEETQTQKVNSLVETPFVVLGIQYVDTSDGRTRVQKMLVRRNDQTLAMYWTPSSWTAIQLEEWFKKYPGRELFCTLTREPLPTGGFKWELVQQEQPESTHASSEDNGAGDQIPFGSI